MHSKAFVKNFIIYTIIFIVAFIFLFPIIITVTNSFMTPFEITNRYTKDITAMNHFSTNDIMHFVEISLIPNSVSLKQYINLLFEQPTYLYLFWNSVKIVIPVVIGETIISVMAAYAFEYSTIKLKEILFLIYIVIMILPIQITLVPNYIVADFFNLENSYLSIILPGIFNPFGVFLIRQFLKSVPIEYIEAAKIDGANHVQIIRYIIIYIVKPAISALIILTFVEYWNVIDQAIIFIKEEYREPLSILLSKLADGNMEIIFAASCFYMLPAILIFLNGQEDMIKGIQLSGLK